MSPQLHSGEVAYGVNETAELLSIGRTTLYSLVKSGSLPACKIGRKTVFRLSDINLFLAALQNQEANR